jgi:hypothetical protein
VEGYALQRTSFRQVRILSHLDANERLPLARQTFRSLLHDPAPLLPLIASCKFAIIGSV